MGRREGGAGSLTARARGREDAPSPTGRSPPRRPRPRAARSGSERAGGRRLTVLLRGQDEARSRGLHRFAGSCQVARPVALVIAKLRQFLRKDAQLHEGRGELRRGRNPAHRDDRRWPIAAGSMGEPLSRAGPRRGSAPERSAPGDGGGRSPREPRGQAGRVDAREHDRVGSERLDRLSQPAAGGGVPAERIAGNPAAAG